MNCIEIETPLGAMLVAERKESLVGLWFLDQRHFPGQAPAWSRRRSSLLAEAEAQVGDYLAGRRGTFDLPLGPPGTAFQQAAWQCLLEIPFGECRSYGEIAARLDKPGAARAVGGAIGRNPLTLIVPCHRVVGRNGALTGFAGGTDRKRWLLAMERGATLDAGARG